MIGCGSRFVTCGNVYAVDMPPRLLRRLPGTALKQLLTHSDLWIKDEFHRLQLIDVLCSFGCSQGGLSSAATAASEHTCTSCRLRNELLGSVQFFCLSEEQLCQAERMHGVSACVIRHARHSKSLAQSKLHEAAVVNCQRLSQLSSCDSLSRYGCGFFDSLRVHSHSNTLLS